MTGKKKVVDDNNRIELAKIKKEIDNLYNKYLKPLYDKKSKVQDKVDQEDCQKLIGKTFIYKNNSFSCPSKKDDYWNNYLKVVGVGKDYGIDCLVVQKDSFGRISIEIETLHEDLMGYEPCSKLLFSKAYNKLMKEVEDLKNGC